MAKPRYKAFLTYSHEDEKWAAWLQRKLESFRIPRRLASRTAGGRAARRLAPIFRDREDLSTAHDLSKRITDALDRSEALVVICSPAAARSRWVNQEIRYFRRLGREDRIFCVIVAGDPQVRAGDKACFPPALFEAGNGDSAEPLAADARKHADGKNLAKLKVIAGLLNVELDELRRREFQRKTRWAAVLTLAAIGILALGVLTMIAQVSERQEREYAEELASFIVDLGEQLQSEVDLETLATIGEQAARHLRRLNPGELSPATQVQVGKVTRQLGRVAQLQGREQDALSYFNASRELLSRLRNEQPHDPDILFELGQTEYRIGELYADNGDDNALEPWKNYLDIARKLAEENPENIGWIMELSYAETNLAALKLQLGTGESDEIGDRLAEAIRLNERAMELAPEEPSYASDYANLLAWAADTQLKVCELDDALSTRRKVLEIAEDKAGADPSDNDLQRRLAYALTGMASVLADMGKVAAAEDKLLEARAKLAALAAADPSNVEYRNATLSRDYLLAWLDSESGRLEEARAEMEAIGSRIKATMKSDEKVVFPLEDYVEFLLLHAEISWRSSERGKAFALLDEAVNIITDGGDRRYQGKRRDFNLWEARYLWWMMGKKDGDWRESANLEVDPQFADRFLSCAEADIAARIETMRGNREAARKHVKYLLSRGYSEPRFMRFCKAHEHCNS